MLLKVQKYVNGFYVLYKKETAKWQVWSCSDTNQVEKAPTPPHPNNFTAFHKLICHLFLSHLPCFVLKERHAYCAVDWGPGGRAVKVVWRPQELWWWDSRGLFWVGDDCCSILCCPCPDLRISIVLLPLRPKFICSIKPCCKPLAHCRHGVTAQISYCLSSLRYTGEHSKAVDGEALPSSRGRQAAQPGPGGRPQGALQEETTPGPWEERWNGTSLLLSSALTFEFSVSQACITQIFGVCMSPLATDLNFKSFLILHKTTLSSL